MGDAATHLSWKAFAMGERHPSDFSRVGSIRITGGLAKHSLNNLVLFPVGEVSPDFSNFLEILILMLFLRLFFLYEKYLLADTIFLDSTGT